MRTRPTAPTVGSRLRIAAAALALLAGGCTGEPGSGSAASAPRQAVQFPVEVETVATRPVEYTVRAVGTVEAFEQVVVTARVAGVVEKVLFQEGDTIDPDTPLALIEPERYRLATASARAALARTEAGAAEARSGLERRQAVNERNPDLVRAEEVDSWRTRLAAARAEVAEAEAALRIAELNERDATPRSPAAGIVQTRQVETGQYVQPGVVLATLVRREPLLLRFRVPESEAASLAPGREVRFSLPAARSEGTYRAILTLVGAAADARDRMVAVTARIDDPARAALRPGAFAEVEAPVGAATTSPVIPQTAIRPSDRGFLAFVVEDGKARERVLQLGLRTADGHVEVRSGLVAGETLVVRGAEALRDGADVLPQSASDARPIVASPRPAEAPTP